MRHTLRASALLGACVLLTASTSVFQQSLPVSISGNQFVRSGKSYQIISGAMHYVRIPREYWRDRFRKARAMGLNTVETYVFWNLHEPRPGVFDFSGNLDVAAYVRMAQQEGLNVIIRPGPYICSEWDMGGLPAWLFADPDIEVRTKDPKFLAAADRYLMRVGQELAPLQATRGGPIVAVQIENEYGSFGDDKEYMEHIHQSLIRAGFGESLLYTADGPDKLTGGTLPGVQAVINFGPGEAKNAFAALEKFQPGRPLMTGEYWDGWFDAWGGRHASTNGPQQADELAWMLKQGYSVNLYVFHGGTTFGFMNGANLQQGPNDTYQPQVTSYDYDAPLDEGGSPTQKYFLFRDVILRSTGVPPPSLPTPLPRITIPNVKLGENTSLWNNLPAPIPAERPEPMERYGQAYGYILYRTQIAGSRTSELVFAGLHDYASVYVNQEPVGQLDRRLKQDHLTVAIPAGHATLDLLLENMGRINYGPHLQDDRKGIVGSVTLDGHGLTGWQVYPLPMADVQGLRSWGRQTISGPAFHRGFFTLDTVGDTFLDVSSLGMGVVWVNGHNLGRVWKIGPQQSLFLPAPWLRKGENEVVVFDCTALGVPALRGVAEPIWKTMEQGK
jgi:beta-galactosidase